MRSRRTAGPRISASLDPWTERRVQPALGFTPDLVTGVWVGFDADRTLGKATGGKLAAPIWTDFMMQALEGRPVRDLPIPEGVDLPGRPTPTPLGASSPGPGGSPGATRKPKPTPTPEALPYDPEAPDPKAPDPEAPGDRDAPLDAPDAPEPLAWLRR